MTQGLPVQNVVNVQVTLSPVAAALRSFGSLLIIAADDVIDTAERVRAYSDLDSIASDFGTTSETYKAALRYFGQSPQPTQAYAGRWVKTASSGLLHGKILTAAQQEISNWTSISDGAMKIKIDGAESDISAVDLSDVTNLNGVASAISTKLSTKATCTWDAALQRFTITSATTGATSTVSYASAPASGTDLSLALAMQQGQTIAPVDGLAAESLVDAVLACADVSGAWYGLVVADQTVDDDDILAVADYIEGAGLSHIFGVTVTDTNALLSTSTDDLAYKLSQKKYERTCCQYSSSEPYAVASLMGRAFTVDFTGMNTTLTLKFKQEPGITAEVIGTSQANALKAKNCNVFVQYNNDTAIIQEGVMASGAFFDEIHGTDWLQNYIQTDIWNLLYTDQTKIGQTDPDINIIVARVEADCDQAVTNGLFAPGVWTGPALGPLANGQMLTKGYLVYAPSVNTQAQADREARKAPTIQVAGKLKGAVHFVNVLVNVVR